MNAEGNFYFVQDEAQRELLRSAYAAVSKRNLWEYLSSRESSILPGEHSNLLEYFHELAASQSDADADGNAMLMLQVVETVAREGWNAFKDAYIRNHRKDMVQAGLFISDRISYLILRKAKSNESVSSVRRAIFKQDHTSPQNPDYRPRPRTESLEQWLHATTEEDINFRQCSPSEGIGGKSLLQGTGESSTIGEEESSPHPRTMSITSDASGENMLRMAVEMEMEVEEARSPRTLGNGSPAKSSLPASPATTRNTEVVDLDSLEDNAKKAADAAAQQLLQNVEKASSMSPPRTHEACNENVVKILKTVSLVNECQLAMVTQLAAALRVRYHLMEETQKKASQKRNLQLSMATASTVCASAVLTYFLRLRDAS
mmetsp:Transcript_9941/g.11526  ORF Transcript_9941/g.11526 Transcript_9941/m.11526 type:complete len:373 (+) Transcript_9941:290-1408(+)